MTEHEKAEPSWERLSDDARVCNHYKMNPPPSISSVSCENRATWVMRSTCGCGEVHMISLRCEDHRIQDLVDDVAKRDANIQSLVRCIRTLNKDIRNDEEGMLFGLGISVSPRPEPDEFWKKNHSGHPHPLRRPPKKAARH